MPQKIYHTTDDPASPSSPGSPGSPFETIRNRAGYGKNKNIKNKNTSNDNNEGDGEKPPGHVRGERTKKLNKLINHIYSQIVLAVCLMASLYLPDLYVAR